MTICHTTTPNSVVQGPQFDVDTYWKNGNCCDALALPFDNSVFILTVALAVLALPITDPLTLCAPPGRSSVRCGAPLYLSIARSLVSSIAELASLTKPGAVFAPGCCQGPESVPYLLPSVVRSQ